jgi:hypothetical protein
MSKAQSAEFWVSTSVFVAAKVNWGLGLHWRPRMLDTKFPLSTWNHGMDSWCYLRIVPTSTHQFPIKKKTTEIVLQELVRNMVLPSYPYLSSAPWELNSTPRGLGLGTTLQNPQQPNSATVLNLSTLSLLAHHGVVLPNDNGWCTKAEPENPDFRSTAAKVPKIKGTWEAGDAKMLQASCACHWIVQESRPLWVRTYCTTSEPLHQHSLLEKNGAALL